MKCKLKNAKMLVLSLLVMALWGSLFPMIKIGYDTLSINSSDIPSILMFAAVRFTLCGMLIVIMALIRKDKIGSPRARTIGSMLLIGLFSITLHYACAYVGISYIDSSKAALIKQVGALIYVCVAFLFFKNESFGIWKIVGGLLGFFGVVAINIDATGFSLGIGEAITLLASVCFVVSSILTKKTLEGASPLWLTGISQLFGGVLLLIAALAMGGGDVTVSPLGILSFLYICTASIVSYLLWSYILATSELSKMLVIKFAEPMFACVFGAVLLGEDIFKWQYLVAFVLISGGILLANKRKVEKDESKNI